MAATDSGSGHEASRYASPTGSRRYRGTGVSPGVATGVVVKLEKKRLPVFRLRLTKSKIPQEMERLQSGIRRSLEQIQVIRERLSAEVGEEHAYILEAQRMMLEDRVMLREIAETIREEGVNAEWAVRHVTDRYLHAYRSLTEAYYRERGCDLADIRTRLIANIAGADGMDLTRLPSDTVLVVEELDPSTLAAVDYHKIRGFVAELGGWTSHTAILARSLQIPAVVGFDRIVQDVASGERIIVDGNHGWVLLSPAPRLVRRYKLQRAARQQKESVRPVAGAARRTHTRDGHRIWLQANADLPREVSLARAQGVDGVGLLRSEFLLLNNPERMPDEEQQFRAFRELAVVSGEEPASVRTLDIGADKFAALGAGRLEQNPALGLRGVRLCLDHPDFFLSHLRAILRASAFGRLCIVLPFVAELGELRQTRRLIEEARCQVEASLGTLPAVPLGVMIELPSAVWMAPALARECDFFCIGTNDLIQYTLGVDRMNQQLAHLFQPLHPAILQSIDRVARAAAEVSLPVTLCGEAACDPLFAFAMLGLGIRRFSVNVHAVGHLRDALQEMSIGDAATTTRDLLELQEIREVQAYLDQQFGRSRSACRRRWLEQHKRSTRWLEGRG